MPKKEVEAINWDSFPNVSIVDYYNIGYPDIIVSEDKYE